MRTLLQLAAIAASLATTPAVRAQISNPNDLVTGPPKPPRPRSHATIKASDGNLQWLWTYAQPKPGGNAVALRTDERFAQLLTTQFKQPQALWGKQVPLAEVIPRFLARYGEVTTKDNRYWMADGCVPSFCAAHGMLWADLGSSHPDLAPLLVFAAVNWSTEGHTTDEANADYYLWLFPSRNVAADTLPLALIEAISDWDARLAQAHRGVPHITHAVLVEPDGQPFPLDPKEVGANTLPPQIDTVTPKSPESD